MHDGAKHPPKLSQDAHHIMRCLYKRLRRLVQKRVEKYTRRSQWNYKNFAQAYAVHFADYAIGKKAVLVLETTTSMTRGALNVLRLDIPKLAECLCDWLSERVWADGNSFDWDGFWMSPDEIATQTLLACVQFAQARLAEKRLLRRYWTKSAAGA